MASEYELDAHDLSSGYIFDGKVIRTIRYILISHEKYKSESTNIDQLCFQHLT